MDIKLIAQATLSKTELEDLIKAHCKVKMNVEPTVIDFSVDEDEDGNLVLNEVFLSFDPKDTYKLVPKEGKPNGKKK